LSPFFEIPAIAKLFFILRDTTKYIHYIRGLPLFLYNRFSPPMALDKPGEWCSISIVWKILVRLQLVLNLPAPPCGQSPSQSPLRVGEQRYHK